MIKVKPIGPWRQLKMLVRNYDERVEYANRILTREVAEKFLKELKSKAPQGDEYKEYIESLEVVHLKDVNGRVVAYAVVSNRKKTTLAELKKEKNAGQTVVFINSSQSSSPLAQLLTENNPWPSDMLPAGLKKGDAAFVSQLVTEGEADYVRRQTKVFLSKRDSELRKLGASWDQKDLNDSKMNGDELEGLPNYMTLGLRAEFGINAKSQPHWKPTLTAMDGAPPKIYRMNRDIQSALFDPAFTDHLRLLRETPDDEVGEKNVDEFKKEAKAFQDRLI